MKCLSKQCKVQLRFSGKSTIFALLTGLSCSFIAPNHILAQVIPDNTLGSEISRVTEDVLIHNQLSDRIDGGAIRGNNLFHSFEQFNVNELQRVYFSNPVDIENILSRVTGNDVSDILGTLGIDGTANLFFLNPNGIIFGENARLDVAGSFVASTADRFTFPDGSEFSAVTPNAPPLLTIGITPGLQYGANPGGTITNEGILYAGNNLTLDANNLYLQGQLWSGGSITLHALDTLNIRDSFDAPFIATSQGEMLIQGDQLVDIFALNHPDSGFFSGSDLILRSANPIAGDAHYWSVGDFRVETLDDSLGVLFSPNDPIIRSYGDVSFDIYQGTSLHILAGGSVDISTVFITAPEEGTRDFDYLREKIRLSDGTNIIIDGSIQPTLDIRAGVLADSIDIPSLPVLTGFSNVTDIFLGSSAVTNQPSNADITVGDIAIRPGNGTVFLTTSYEPNLTLEGGTIIITGIGEFGDGIDARSYEGNGSNVILDSRNRVEILNSSINSSSDVSQESNVDQIFEFRAGNIDIIADYLLISADSSSVFDGKVNAGNSGRGDGGDISIRVTRNVNMDGDVTLTSSAIEGNAGNIFIDAGGNVSLSNQVVLASQFFGEDIEDVSIFSSGNPGIITINAGNDIHVTDRSSITTGFTGNGGPGQISLRAGDSVTLARSAILSTSTSGVGDAGNIAIHAGREVNVDGSQVFSTVRSEMRDRLSAWNQQGVGDAGEIIIEAQSILLSSGSQLRTSVEGGANDLASGEGNAGIITLDADDRIFVNGGSQISSNTAGEGNAGKVNLHANGEILIRGFNSRNGQSSGVFTNTEEMAQGNGGNIRITAPRFTIENGAVVDARTANDDRGGDIEVNADFVEVHNGGQLITTTSGNGNAGNIALTVREHASLIGMDPSFNYRLEEFGQDAITSVGNGESGLFASTEPASIGDGGIIDVRSQRLDIEDRAQIIAATEGEGRAGSLSVNTEQLNLRNRAEMSVSSTGSSLAGSLNFDVDNLRLGEQSIISAETIAGSGGNIILSINNALNLSSGSQISVLTQDGTGGRLTVGTHPSPTQRIILQGESQITSEATGTGNAGTLDINAEQLRLNGNSAILASTESGRGGDIILQGLNNLRVNQSRVSASTDTGRAGNLTVEAANTINLNGEGGLLVEAEGDRGRAGNLSLTTSRLMMQDGAEIAASTTSGIGGDISLRIADTINLQSGSQISAATDTGVAGNLNVSTSEQIILNNGSRLSVEARRNRGEAGTLTLTTPQLMMQDGAEISATNRSGVSGTLTVQADDITLEGRSEISASTRSGQGGDVVLRGLETLELGDRSSISATTRTGAAGSLFINQDGNAAQRIVLDGGSRLSVEAIPLNNIRRNNSLSASTFNQTASDENNTVGIAGNLTLRTNDLQVLNGSSITVSSPEGQAGNLTITARTIQLDDNGQLTAVTGDLGREDGANITLNTEELLVMRNGSLISAEALGAANGGNVRINADNGFIIAPPFEDSDIIANAEFGNGGRIDITTRGIYGLEFRDELTSLSDITASSEFGLAGEIIIDTPDIDPNRGTAELPSNVIDASDSVAQACPSGVGTTTLGSFVVTGRGGLPPHPDAILDNDDVAADWVTPTDATQYNHPSNTTVQPQQDSQTIVEADGWVMQPDGRVMLVSKTQNTMPRSAPESCPVSPR